MRRLFWLESRLGDVLCGIPTFRKLREMYPNDHLAWCVSPQYRDVIPQCANSIEANRDGSWNQIIDAHPWHFHKAWGIAKVPLPTFISRLAGINETRFAMDLDVTEEDNAAAAALLRSMGVGSEFAVVNAGPHYSGPSWSDAEKQQAILMLRRRGLDVVALAGPDGTKFTNCHNCFSLTLRQSAALIGMSKVYMGQDCGTSWLACAFRNNRKIILIDRSPGRPGYDSYVDCMIDNGIREFPIGTSLKELEAAIG